MLRRDRIAERFRHLATLRIDREAVREHTFIGRAAVDRDRGEQ